MTHRPWGRSMLRPYRSHRITPDDAGSRQMMPDYADG